MKTVKKKEFEEYLIKLKEQHGEKVHVFDRFTFKGFPYKQVMIYGNGYEDATDEGQYTIKD